MRYQLYFLALGKIEREKKENVKRLRFNRYCLIHKQMKDHAMPQCYNSGWFSKIWLSQKRLKCTESYKLGCSACLLQNTFCNEKKYILRNVQKIQVGVGRYNLPVSPRRPPPVLPLQMELPSTQTGISKIFRYWQRIFESKTNCRDHEIFSGVSMCFLILPVWMRSDIGGKCADRGHLRHCPVCVSRQSSVN